MFFSLKIRREIYLPLKLIYCVKNYFNIPFTELYRSEFFLAKKLFVTFHIIQNINILLIYVIYTKYVPRSHFFVIWGIRNCSFS